MRCIFVLDILNGAVVHALRGERSCYQPIAAFSRVVSTSEPLGVLRAIHPKEAYVADLNQLTGRGNNLAVIGEISKSAKTMADIGICKAADLDLIPPAVAPVLGTETASLSLIERAAAREIDRRSRIVVSIDMKKGRLLASDPDLAERMPLDLLRILNQLDLEAVILLDLERVGASTGLDRPFLEEAAAASEHPLILGGGIRGDEDLEALEEMGFAGALLATAIHNGRIPLSRVQ